MPLSLLESAISYAERGWHVFPCHAQGKAPLTPRGLNDATTDERMIRTWWTRWPDANIGVATGERSGIYVVDVDVANGKSGEASLEALLNGVTSFRTLEARTGSGGRHLFFAWPGGDLRNTTSSLGADIDTRANGGYVIVAPSIHDSGGVYEWINDIEPAAPPECLITRAKSAAPAPAPAPTTVRIAANQPELGTRIKRASAYIKAMPPSISGSGGHNAAFAAARALITGFDLPAHLATNIFAADFNLRCQPPWSAKEIRHKIMQAQTTPSDHQVGYLLDVEPDTTAGERSASAILANIQNPPADNEPDPEPQLSATASLPAHLLQPPGYVGELCQWINSTAFKPQPELALANALAFFGAILGRKVRDSSDLRTNLYCLGVGASGCGKDHSRRAIKKLASEAGLTSHMMGGEDISSDSAILSAVHAHPTILFQLDEVGHFFANANNRNAQVYQRAIPVTFTKLYSSSNTVYLGKEYADRDTNARRDINQPNVCIYGTTVPDRLYEGISSAEIRDGFLGRMLVFYAANDDPDPVDREAQDTPRSLIEMAEAWFTRDVRSNGKGNVADIVRIEPMEVTTQADAQAVFLKFRQAARQRRRDAMKKGGGLDSLWSRAEENARKVALILACGCEFAGPVIGREVAAYACELVNHLVSNLVESIGHHVADSEFGRNRLRILSAIRDRGGSLTRSQLTRVTRGLRGRDRDEVLTDLIQANEIRRVERKSTSGPPAVVYELCDEQCAAGNQHNAA